MSTVKSNVTTTNGIGRISRTADAMAPMSAPMFTVFAIRISADGRDQYFFVVILADHLRDPLFCHRADPRARFLHGCHKGIQENGRPKLAVAELRARLRIGRDARRIVIRRARNKAGAQNAEYPRKPMFRFLIIFICFLPPCVKIIP